MFFLFHIPLPNQKLYYLSDDKDTVVCSPIIKKAKKFSTRDFAIMKSSDLFNRFGLDFLLESEV